MTDSRLRVVVGVAFYTKQISYYDDWLDAFCKSDLFETEVVNIIAPNAYDDLKRKQENADAIILLHATNGDTLEYLEPLADLLAERKCPLLSFVGNEFNFPGAYISDKRALFQKFEPDFIATQLLEEAGAFLFSDVVKRKVVSVPHALNPDVFQFKTPHKDRVWDIGGRAVTYLPHLGDCERNELHDFFNAHTFDPTLKVDISNDRFDRAGWAAYLNSCRGTVSSEAGSWYLERDDRTVKAIEEWIKSAKTGASTIRSDSLVARLAQKLPYGLKQTIRSLMKFGPIRYESAVKEELDFQEVYDLFFKETPKAPVYSKCISSRHFDAIGTGTCQILVEGRYNDLLTPNEHYIALKADYSNLQEVMEIFHSPESEKIAQTVSDYVRENHTYVQRAKTVYDILISAHE